jgi:hypothetical protein
VAECHRFQVVVGTQSGWQRAKAAVCVDKGRSPTAALGSEPYLSGKLAAVCE